MRFKILGRKGDAVLDYDLETAEVKFNELVSNALVPFANPNGGQLEKVEHFDKSLEEVTWLPKIVGG